MPKEHPCRGRERIELLLEGRLTGEEQSQFEEHLAKCATCRDHLQTTAAGPAYWEEAAAYLRSDVLDEESGAASLAGLAAHDDFICDEKPNGLRITDYFDLTDDP